MLEHNDELVVTAVLDAGYCCRHLRGYHHGAGEDRRPVIRNGKKVAPARKYIDQEFVLRGFLRCCECGYSLTSCWSSSGTGKRYPYYLCHHKGCSQRGKSIARDKLESEFELIMKGLTPTTKTIELASRMFREAWDRYRSTAKEESSRHRTRQRQIDTEVSSLIDRAARTHHDETARAYEKRIVELRSEAAVLDEKLARQSIPEGTKTCSGTLQVICRKRIVGAGGGNRTPISSLENWGLNHYTTPAQQKDAYFMGVRASRERLRKLLMHASYLFHNRPIAAVCRPIRCKDAASSNQPFERVAASCSVHRLSAGRSWH